MVTKNGELLQDNPFAYDKYEYDMDNNTWFNETQSFSDEELQKMQREYESQHKLTEEEKQRKAEGEKSKQVKVQEVKEELLLDDNQIKLKESVSEDITEVNVKAENILTAPGEAVAPPKYIGWDKAFTIKQKDDSEKMANIRTALAKYHEVKGEPAEADALRRVIQYCNNYTWMKVPFLKFGKAKKRLNEVKRLRKEAEEALEQSPYKDNYSFVEHEHDEVVKETTADEQESKQFIYSETGDYIDNIEVSTAGRVAASITGILTWMVLFPLEVVTYPLRAMAYGVDKLYRKAEKAYGVRDERREINMGINYKPGHYYTKIITAAHNPIFTKSGKKKDQIIKKHGEMDDEMYTTSQRARFLEQGQDDIFDLKKYKRELIKEYNKKKPDKDKILRLEGNIDTLEGYVNGFVEDLKTDYEEDAKDFDFDSLTLLDEQYKEAKKKYYHVENLEDLEKDKGDDEVYE